jgi:hypothetical protein
MSIEQCLEHEPAGYTEDIRQHVPQLDVGIFKNLCDEGILFYGLRKGTSQVYVSRRRVRLSFGVKPPI